MISSFRNLNEGPSMRLIEIMSDCAYFESADAPSANAKMDQEYRWVLSVVPRPIEVKQDEEYIRPRRTRWHTPGARAGVVFRAGTEAFAGLGSRGHVAVVQTRPGGE